MLRVPRPTGRGGSSLWQRRSSSPAAGTANNNSNNNNNNNINASSSASLTQLDDADVAAGAKRFLLPTPPPSSSVSRAASQSDLEFFEDMVSEPVLVLGFDISHLSRNVQFLVCASGVFLFSLLYGYLQELISVQIANRQLALFLAAAQFTGYTGFAFLLRTYVYEQRQKIARGKQRLALERGDSLPLSMSASSVIAVPLLMYLGLSLLRAVDLGMTNLSMQYINYPAKTLMKSSRVVFTMMFGVFIARKRYRAIEYLVVSVMVLGLIIFMHADAQHSAVFQPIGVVMLTISLVCDGAISNMSEAIMNNYGVCQDEFIFRMYSISLVALTVAAAVKGDLKEGMHWLQEPGTYQEQHDGVPFDQRTWSVHGKILVLLLFSCMGFVGSSCSAAITKNFGALTMSITSTARKATTLFLSFFLFDNECTTEHVFGIVIFITALLAKSWMRRGLKAKRKPRMMSRSLSTASYTAEESEPLKLVEDLELAHHHHHHGMQDANGTEPTPLTPRKMVQQPSSYSPRIPQGAHVL